MSRPPSKLPEVGTTIFTVMSKLAADCGAINLSQGFPDFSAPAELLERVSHHLRAGHNQYAPMAGVAALREQLAEQIAFRLVEGEVTVTSGATEALFCAIQAFAHPGDEVMIFDPAYDAYEPAARLAGARAVHVPLTPPAFGIDWQRVRDSLTARTRVIVLNSPHNPTGAVLDAADLEALAAIVRDRPIVLVSDEVYEHIIFDGRRHESLLRHAELAERALVISSFGKTYHATGWKIGYCVAPAPLMGEFRKVHQFVQFCVVTPMQLALADFMDSTPEHYLDLPAFYQAKRDLFCELLAPSRFRFTPSPGTYFQLVDYGAISPEPDVDFARRLTRETGVAAIPISVFCQQPPTRRWLRFCFAKEARTLERAAQLLCRL
ncbi:MAG: methionine aminotransferase [Gammaproteobacteria bacterium]|nr:methionine aminotransferase [Gammaproteobacteria bacterium]